MESIYPQPIRFNDHCAVLSVAFDHHVSYRALFTRRKAAAYARELIDKRWRVHPYLATGSDRQPEPQRDFFPQSILLPQLHDSVFGRTRFGGDSADEKSLAEFIMARLRPDRGAQEATESLLFTLDDPAWLNRKLEAKYLLSRSSDEKGVLSFMIEWVDLWLFNDGVGMISLKVKSLDDASKLNTLTTLGRELRELAENLWVRPAADEAITTYHEFWHELVLSRWLGVSPIRVLGQHRLANQTGCQNYSPGLMRHRNGSGSSPLDRFVKRCKLLLFAQLPLATDERSSFNWGRPLCEPPLHYHEESYNNLLTGRWDANLLAAQKAIYNGCATVRDLLLFELATLSNEQASIGQNGSVAWQYSLEYIRKEVDTRLIEIWEYWTGMALKEILAFISFQEHMPINRQVEAWYYPLQVLVYHNRYKLDTLSQQVVDYGMSDVGKGNALRDEFQCFRNQYWFQDCASNFMGIEVYQQLNASMNVQQQFDIVSQEISEVSAFIHERWQRAVRNSVAVLLVLLAPFMSLWDAKIYPRLLASSAGERGAMLLLLCIGFCCLWIFGRPLRKLLRALSKWIVQQFRKIDMYIDLG